MTKDEFEKLAFDGGAWEYLDLEGDSVARLIVYTLVLDAIKIEREACAKVVEDYLSVGLAKEMSRIIRDRGNQ